MADNSTTDVLSMSLDDIIKQKADKPERRGAGGKQARAQRGGDRGGDRGGKRFEQSLKVTVAGKAAGGRGGRRSEGSRREALPDVPRNLDALDGDAAWEHDLFEGGGSQRARRIRPAVDGFKLLITNLDFKVTDDDIQELFENCGTVKKAGVIYDRSGRSEEAAEVVFERKEDALAALKRYNNLALDNKPMKIELIEHAADAPAAGRMLASGIRIGTAPRGAAPRAAAPLRSARPARAAGRGGGGGGGFSRQARGRGATVSANDLDRELDSYMATD